MAGGTNTSNVSQTDPVEEGSLPRSSFLKPCTFRPIFRRTGPWLAPGSDSGAFGFSIIQLRPRPCFPTWTWAEVLGTQELTLVPWSYPAELILNKNPGCRDWDETHWLSHVVAGRISMSPCHFLGRGPPEILCLVSPGVWLPPLDPLLICSVLSFHCNKP